MKTDSIIAYFFAFYLGLWSSGVNSSEAEEGSSQQRFKIDGKVIFPKTANPEWLTNTRIMVDGGEYLGFVRSDGAFSVNDIPTGSYIVEVVSPNYVFEPARVDITSKGKLRARRLNNIQPSLVQTITYPLKFKAIKANYFQQREQWRITDFLMSPMVLMMVLPFLMLMVLPKLMNTQDPETQKEMQQQMSFLNNPKQSMPDMSELFTSWFGGGQQAKKAASRPKAVKKRQ